jgi:hypothetical protein
MTLEYIMQEQIVEEDLLVVPFVKDRSENIMDQIIWHLAADDLNDNTRTDA